MRRRDLLAGLLATTTATAVRAAEPNRVYRLAFCNHFKRLPRGPIAIRIFDRLRQLGYIEGKNLVADGYFAEDRPERYAEIARKAVQAKPDVIVVSWDNQLLAQVAKETSTIPILWQMPSLDAGFVRNPARPEGNITGFAFDAGTEMQGKHLDILPSCPICVPYRLSLKPLRLGRDLGACGCPGWAQFGHFNYRHTDGPLGRGRGLSSSI
ncbi:MULTISPECIES: ABC transporter substrate binding protein [unclassified Bradyrhizobium]